MTRTRVGYIGGRSANPTYHDLADHAEGVEVHYDPERIRYEALLEHFWTGHDPTRPKGSTQYRAALFCADEEEAEVARASRVRCAQRLGAAVETEILVGRPFHAAEAYHQKWRLRRDHRLFVDLQGCFRSEAELLDSVAAAKLNGWVGGQTSRARIEPFIEDLGLTSAAQRYLLDQAQ